MIFNTQITILTINTNIQNECFSCFIEIILCCTNLLKHHSTCMHKIAIQYERYHIAFACTAAVCDVTNMLCTLQNIAFCILCTFVTRTCNNSISVCYLQFYLSQQSVRNARFYSWYLWGKKFIPIWNWVDIVYGYKRKRMINKHKSGLPGLQKHVSYKSAVITQTEACQI